MALVCSVQTFCYSATLNDRVNLRGHLGWLCPFAQASLDNSCYLGWRKAEIKSSQRRMQKILSMRVRTSCLLPRHLLEAVVSQFSHFFECSLVCFISWSPQQCIGGGYSCWLVYPLSIRVDKMLPFPASFYVQVMHRVRLLLWASQTRPGFLQGCAVTVSLPRDTVEGEAERMMSCSWLNFPQREKVQGKNNAPSQGFHKIPKERGCKSYNPQMSVST